MLNEVASLVRIITSRTATAPPVLDLRERASSKEQLLVSTVKHAPEITRLQLARAVYGSPSPANLQALQKLQSRVQAKLLNQLYFLDHSDPRYLVSRRYELECMGLLHKVTVLYAERDFRLGERLLLRCLKLAQKGEFTQYVVLAARMLRNLYADQRKGLPYKKISVVLQRARQQLAWEDEAEELQVEAQLAGNSSVALRHQMLATMPARIARLQALHKQARSFTTYNLLYRVRLWHEELQGNFTALIRIASATDRDFRAGRLNPRRFDQRYNHYVLTYAYLRNRQPKRGLLLAGRFIQHIHPSSGNWFYFQENHLLLALHAARYAQARELLDAVASNPAYPAQRDLALQRWDLYRAYLDFVLPPVVPLAARHEQLARQLLVLPEYSRDKRGYNVAILVLQLLHFLRSRHLEAVLLRLERLRKYQQRHLTGPGTMRSRLFLRLLQLMVDQHFNPAKVAAQGQGLLLQLRDAPHPGEAFAEVEIIPYENLWAVALNLLRQGPPLAGED